MRELITVNFDTQTVSARELHKQVGSTERFSAWFERQLQYGFVENEDYTGCKKFNTLVKQELQDYELSVDMAKEICMVQKNENARKVRNDYLSGCDRITSLLKVVLQEICRCNAMWNKDCSRLRNLVMLMEMVAM